MVMLDIGDVLPDFPAYRVALVAAWDLRVAVERSADLAEAVDKAERTVATLFGATPPAEIPSIKLWRDAYRAFGVKKTSYRSSAERLLRSVQQGRGLPRVNTLVDAYNAISALHLMPVGADDLEKIVPPLAFRRARPGDSFVALGDDSARDDPPKDGEIVYADAQKLLCRRWNWYQDGRGAVSAETTRAVLTVQSLTPAPAVERAAAELCDWIADHCGGGTAWAVAEAGTPRVTVADN